MNTVIINHAGGRLKRLYGVRKRSLPRSFLATALVAASFIIAHPSSAQDKNKLFVTYDPDAKNVTLVVPSTSAYPKRGKIYVTGLKKSEVESGTLTLLLPSIDNLQINISGCSDEAQDVLCTYEVPDGVKAETYKVEAHVKVGSDPAVVGSGTWKYDGAAVSSVEPSKAAKNDNGGGTSGGGSNTPAKFKGNTFACDVNELRQCAYRNAIHYVGALLDADDAASLLGEKWPQNIYKTYVEKDDIAVVFFDDKGVPLFALPQVDEDDRLFVVVVPEHGTEIGEVRVTACGARSPLNIAGSLRVEDDRATGLGTGPEKERSTTMKVHIVEASNGCSSDGGFKATFSAGNEVREIPIETLKLNRVTLGLGLVYDWSRQTEYRAATVAGENVPIIVKDEHVRGLLPPVPFAAIRPFAVDTQRTRDWYQSFALNIGFSWTEPLDHLMVGLLIDPIPGLGFTAGYHFRREPVLASGYREGDHIEGGQVPTDKRWKDLSGTDLFVGLNVDAAVLLRIAGGLVK